MTRFLLHHRHTQGECPVTFAAWRGFESPLRHGVALGSCGSGGHELWWELEAESEEAALRQLPHYVAERTRVIQVAEVEIP